MHLLKDKIIFIPNADPGYDWIFSQNIAGLITKFGGSNSHISIRCNEYGINAAIGCGEVLFGRIKCAEKVQIDCENKILKPLA